MYQREGAAQLLIFQLEIDPTSTSKRPSMPSSEYQSVSTMTPRFAAEVLTPIVLSSASAQLPSFRCGECPRQFTRHCALQEHLAAHSGAKAYRCPVRDCGKCFTTASNLARHCRLHGDELRLFRCPDPSCTKAFPTLRKLQCHMRAHTCPPMHHCKFAHCKKSFSSTGNLNRHMRNQHIRFGHPLTNTSPTSVDVKLTTMFGWSEHAGKTAFVDKNMPSSNFNVSDEELLEVLSCLFDDEPATNNKEAEDATAKASTIRL